MKVQPQLTDELRQMASLIEPMSVAMMTTAEADRGALASRPMSPLEMDASGAIWFFTDLRSSKVEQLRAVNLAFSDEARACYISVSGRGEIHSDRSHIERLWTPFAKPWFPDGPESTNLALLKVVIDTVEYWDAPNSKMVRMLAMAASVLAGKPIGLGDHAKHTGMDSSASVSAAP